MKKIIVITSRVQGNVDHKQPYQILRFLWEIHLNILRSKKYRDTTQSDKRNNKNSKSEKTGQLHEIRRQK